MLPYSVLNFAQKHRRYTTTLSANFQRHRHPRRTAATAAAATAAAAGGVSLRV